MSNRLRTASFVAVAATFISALVGFQGSGAVAQDRQPTVRQAEATRSYIAQPVVQPLPAPRIDAAAPADLLTADDTPPTAESLSALVESQPQTTELSRELRCLAGAVYFEAKSESLEGQLAVARVVVARSKSGRFPDSYCGVVFQPSQFSFVQGGAMPAIRENSRFWRNAVAVAQIAHAGAWRSPVEGALFFHATHVSPRWRLSRIARVDNHIFYR